MPLTDKTAALYASLLRSSLTDSTGLLEHDLAAIIILSRDTDQHASTDAANLAEVSALIDGDAATQTRLGALIDSVEDLSDADFGPVRLGTPAAAKRLELLYRVDSGSATARNATVAFVTESDRLGADALSLFAASVAIHDALADNSVRQRRWRDRVVPPLLQTPGVAGSQGSYEQMGLTAWCAGAAMPADWSEAVVLIRAWARERANNPQDFDLDGDTSGFFRPYVDGYRPAGWHPAVLAVLIQEFHQRLDAGESPALALAYARWLVGQVFADAQSHDRATPQVAFAAGSLILSLIRRADIAVAIGSDGTLSAPGTSQAWKELTEQMLDCVARSCERNGGGVPTWSGSEVVLKRLLFICPAWHRSAVLEHLERRAGDRLRAVLAPLAGALPQQTDQVESLNLVPLADTLAHHRMPELRPSVPLSEAMDGGPGLGLTGTWKDYYQGLDDISQAASDLDEQAQTALGAAHQVRGLRQAFEDRAASPLARSVLPGLVGSLPDQQRSHRIVAPYLSRQLAEVRLAERRSAQASADVTTLADRADWQDAVNAQTAAVDVRGAAPATERSWWESVGRAWARLEPWDALRGRLSEAELDVNDPDLEVAQVLLDRIETWLANGNPSDPANLPAARAALAALAHLGVAPDARHDRRNRLVAEIEARLAQDDTQVPVALKRTLAATRLELALTALASDPDATLEQLLGAPAGTSMQALGRLLDWIRLALGSNTAWESRAGLNAVLGLSRAAQALGEVALIQNLQGLIDSATDAATESGARLEVIIRSTRTLLETGTGPSGVSALALALIGNDLRARLRDEAAGLPAAVSSRPGWLAQGETAIQVVEGLGERLIAQGPAAFAPFRHGGGQAAKSLVLALLDIQQGQLQLRRELSVAPLTREQMAPLLELQGVARAMLCVEELLLSGPPESVPATPPWWRLQYWSALAPLPEDGMAVAERMTLTGLDADVADSLDREELPDTLAMALGLTQARTEVRIVAPSDRWLALGGTDERRIIRLRRPFGGAATTLDAEVLEPRFPLLDWAQGYAERATRSALQLGAQIEAETRPPWTREMQAFDLDHRGFKDVDGRYAGSLNRLTFQAARGDLEAKVEDLKTAETEIERRLEEQRERWDQATVVELLKQPLRLASADFQEKLQAAAADVRRAEAELQVAESEKLAAELEQFASSLTVEALDLERERLAAATRIAELDTQIADLEAEAQALGRQIAQGGVDVREQELKLAQNQIRRADLKQQQAIRARVGIKREIEMVRRLLGSNTSDKHKVQVTLADGTALGAANGQLAVLALQVDHSVRTQLAEDKAEAEAALKDAKAKERERKRRAKRRALVNAVCRFIGTAVGAYFGGPTGATLGAEIGGAVAELGNGIAEDKPADEIFVGLIDNAFAISKAAGFDLQRELDDIGEKAAGELKDLFDDIEANLDAVVSELPEVFDAETLETAFEVLGFEEVPQMSRLIDSTLDDLKAELKVEDLELGKALASVNKGDAINVEDAGQLRTFLGEKLFGNMDKTRSGIDQIERLARKLDHKLDDLATAEGREKAARGIAERMGKLVITRLGQETAALRRNTVAAWIDAKREAEKAWEEVAAEGEALLAKLFPDPDQRADMLAELEAALLPREAIRAKMQGLMKAWQDKLDDKLQDVMSIQDPPKPRSAVEAAQQALDYITEVEGKFSNDLVPWLEGKNNDERNDLLAKLDGLQAQELDAATDVDVSAIDVASAQIDAEIAQQEIARAQTAVDQAERLTEAAELGVNKNSWKVKIAELAERGFENQAAVTKTMHEAAAERVRAADARIRAARAELQATEALERGAANYATEAGRTRQALNAPPLRLPGADSAAIAEHRARHAERLATALARYRELLRYLRAVGFEEGDGGIPPLSLPGATATGPSTWGRALEDWLGEVDDGFLDPQEAILSNWRKLSWELTPTQVAALMGVSGFRIVVSDRKSIENPRLFRVSATDGGNGSLREALQTGDVSGFLFDAGASDDAISGLLTEGLLPAPWHQRLAENGIDLSQAATLNVDRHFADHWQVNDRFEPEPGRLRTRRLVITTIDGQLKVFGRSPWVELFAGQGIPLSRRLQLERDDANDSWKLSDQTIRPVSVTTFGDDNLPRRRYRLDADRGGESQAYEIRREGATDAFSVHLVHDGRFGAGRSAPADRVFEEEAQQVVKTGRIAGLFIVAETNNGELKETDFAIQVSHAGDRWVGTKRLELHKRPNDPLALLPARANALASDASAGVTDLIPLLNAKRNLGDGEDPDPFVFEGTPLSGTTVIRLVASGQTELYRATIHLLFKHYQ